MREGVFLTLGGDACLLELYKNQKGGGTEVHQARANFGGVYLTGGAV